MLRLYQLPTVNCFKRKSFQAGWVEEYLNAVFSCQFLCICKSFFSSYTFTKYVKKILYAFLLTKTSSAYNDLNVKILQWPILRIASTTSRQAIIFNWAVSLLVWSCEVNNAKMSRISYHIERSDNKIFRHKKHANNRYERVDS